MKRKRFAEEQIITVLQEHEAGATVEELKRRHGVSSSSVYAWKRQLGRPDLESTIEVGDTSFATGDVKPELAPTSLVILPVED